MKISYNWLKDYVETGESPRVIAKWLTDSGLEVESLEKHETVKGGLEGVVVGKVLTCEKHPNADNLTLTTVDIGEDSPLTIVCGAPNVKAGQKVPVAKTGSNLHTSKGPFEIKKTKIRGQTSYGMICAEDELGLGTSHEGIMVLNPDTPVGTPAKEYFQIEEDWIYEIGLTPNRIDGASHIGAARDLVAVINHLYPKEKKQLKKPSVDNFKPDDNSLYIPVEIQDEEACPRYSGITISGITIDESPLWLKNKLLSIGLKPINNIVDITNFVLHETGQPLHAFDASKITGNKVIIKRPHANTVFTTLDNDDIKLTGDDLMICNTEESMCLAGVLGGIHSGITNDTKDLFLESAYFNPGFIRRSSKHHQLNTDASFRFERGSDPNITVYALKRAAKLIKEIAGGKISSEIVDEYPKPVENHCITFHYGTLNKLSGKVIEKDVVKNILNSLEIEIKKEDNNLLELSVPPFRVDVTRPADIVEEVLRIYGYNNIEIPEKTQSSIVLSPKPDKELLQNKISDMLSGQGFREIMNNSLTNSAYYENNNGHPPQNTVKILNPISKDLDALRQTLLYGCLETITRNINHRNFNLKFYEFGNTYKLINSDTKDPLDKYDEKVELALVMTGMKYSENWKSENVKTDFFDLKNHVLLVIKKLGINPANFNLEEKKDNTCFQYELNYKLNGKDLITIGKVSQNILQRSDIEQDVFFASLNWQEIVDIHAKYEMQFDELPKFPEVRRDLALLIDENITYKQIEQLAFKTEKKHLIKVNLFDVYQDEKIGKNKKSYAVSFVLRDNEKTMTDKQIEKIMQKLTEAYQKELGATIR